MDEAALEGRAEAAEARVRELEGALKRIAGMGGNLAFAGDVARSALIATPTENGDE